jgi:hypothetical protein
MRVGVSGRKSEFRESAVEGIRLCQEDLACDCTCAVVTVLKAVATERILKAL